MVGFQDLIKSSSAPSHSVAQELGSPWRLGVTFGSVWEVRGLPLEACGKSGGYLRNLVGNQALKVQPARVSAVQPVSFPHLHSSSV